MTDPDAALGRAGAAVFLARIRPLAAAAGVTRLAVLTGLDHLQIPVAAAMRPNSRSIAVHQGKGLSLAAAKVSALMEAIECHCAETLQLPLRLAAAAALPGALDPATLPGGRATRDTRLLWVEGRCLWSGDPVWVPRELVSADFSADAGAGPALFQASTNGLASGATLAEATAHAVQEVIERDAMARFHAAGRTAWQHRRIDLGARFSELGDADTDVAAWDATTDGGVPVVTALLRDRRGQVQPESGSACHPDPAVALLRAVLEAAQARLTVISGARDDFAPADYDAAAQGARAEAARAWLQAPATQPLPPPATGTPPDWLARAGCGRAGVVDLTQPAFAIPVVRVVAAGLRGPWAEP